MYEEPFLPFLFQFCFTFLKKVYIHASLVWRTKNFLSNLITVWALSIPSINIKYERSCLHVYRYIYAQVIILIKLYIEPPEYLHVHVLYIQVTQINTSTTLCSSRKRIKYLCIFRYLNSGLTTCTESSYWRFKKWVHVIYHKQSSISKDVEEMLRVHGREGWGGTKIFLHYRRTTCSKLCFFKSNNHQTGLFLSLKITSTFDAPGVCVDIKIQVINIHVYIVARRFEHDKYR